MKKWDNKFDLWGENRGLEFAELMLGVGRSV